MMRALALFPLMAMAMIPSCDPPPRPTLDLVVRRWSFSKVTLNSTGEEQIGEDRVQVGGSVAETIDFGPLVLIPPPFFDRRANAEVFSNDTGRTYWVGAVAPSAVVPSGIRSATRQTSSRCSISGRPIQTPSCGSSSAEHSSKRSIPTRVNRPPRSAHGTGARGFGDCLKIMSAFASFTVTAFSFFDQTTLMKTGGRATLDGFAGRWDFNASTDAGSTLPFWSTDSFGFERDVDGDGGGHATAELLRNIAIDVPLSSVRVGDSFYVAASVKATRSTGGSANRTCLPFSAIPRDRAA